MAWAELLWVDRLGVYLRAARQVRGRPRGALGAALAATVFVRRLFPTLLAYPCSSSHSPHTRPGAGRLPRHRPARALCAGGRRRARGALRPHHDGSGGLGGAAAVHAGPAPAPASPRGRPQLRPPNAAKLPPRSYLLARLFSPFMNAPLVPLPPFQSCAPHLSTPLLLAHCSPSRRCIDRESA